MKKEKISCERFIEMKEEDIGTMIKEMKYCDEFDTDRVMKVVERWAVDENYDLYDIDDFDYDGYLSNNAWLDL